MNITNQLNDTAVTEELGRRLLEYRLNLNLTQAALADQAGVSKRTVERLEAGHSTQLSNFIRICRALGLAEGFNQLVPQLPPSPLEQIRLKGKQRQRASSPRAVSRKVSEPEWTWGDE